MPQTAIAVAESPGDTATILRVVYFTAAGTVSVGGLILCDATSGAFTLSLPAAASIEGRQLIIKKTDVSANAVTVDGDGAETIDGTTTQSLSSQYDSITIVSDRDNNVWHIAS